MKKLTMFALAFAAAFTFSFTAPVSVQAAEPETESEIEVITEEAMDPTLTYEEELLALINAEREKNGLSVYTLDEAVDTAAEARIYELEDVFSHRRDGGKHFSTILSESGISYRAASETIAAGQTTPQRVFDAWMESPRHRSRILSSEYTKVGIAHDRDDDDIDFWEMLYLN